MKNKTFDSVGWMRKRREKIDEEDQGLTWGQKHEKTCQLIENDPLWLRLKDRAVKPTGSLSIALQESRGKYGRKKTK
jgi:hypothetical protein